MELIDTSTVIGEVSLKWESESNRQGEIGFALHSAFHGRGFAAEATQAVIQLGFEDLALHRIVARCIEGNTDSLRLLRRLGMQQEAFLRHSVLLKGEWANQLVYGLLEDEWRLNSQGDGDRRPAGAAIE